MRRVIAYVDHATQVGGAEKSLVELIAHLDRERWDPVIVHAPGAQWLRYAQACGARLHPGVPPSDLYEARRDELPSGVVANARRALGARSSRSPACGARSAAWGPRWCTPTRRRCT